MTYYGIYKITNLTNGKMYIGQHKTTDIDDGYMGSGKIIKLAIKKYGVENFRKEWLMFCEDEEELDYMERVYVDQTWVDRSDTYNLNLGGDCQHLSEQTRKKLSEICKVRYQSEESRKKISEALKGNHNHKGKHHSEETKRKLSMSSKGRQHSEDTRHKMSLSRKGKTTWIKNKHHSEETRKKMSESHKGKTPS